MKEIIETYYVPGTVLGNFKHASFFNLFDLSLLFFWFQKQYMLIVKKKKKYCKHDLGQVTNPSELLFFSYKMGIGNIQYHGSQRPIISPSGTITVNILVYIPPIQFFVHLSTFTINNNFWTKMESYYTIAL